MSRKNLLMGYFPSDLRDADFSKSEVLAEVSTGGHDCNGYEEAETIGVALSEYGNMQLFRSSIHDLEDEHTKKLCVATAMRRGEMVSALRKLADELDNYNPEKKTDRV